MRAQPAEYQLLAPGSLSEVVALLAQNPGTWLPIAGGTDLMVQYSAGKLSARNLISIWNLPKLRQIENLPGEIHIGPCCTFTHLREHQTLNRQSPFFARAAPASSVHTH